WFSVRHWTDRYSQVILIALGESVISLGTARTLSEASPPSWPLVGTSMLGLVVIAMLAFAYFDDRVPAGEQALRNAEDQAQRRLAREWYAFIHLPMIIGILTFSLGLNRIRTAVAAPTVSNALPTGVLTASLLYGGVLLYLVALYAFQL